MIWSILFKEGVGRLENVFVNEPYGFVYIVTNLTNGKRYVGQRKFDNRGKWKSYMGSGTEIKMAIDKYGKKNFKRDIVYVAYNFEELSQAEQEIIQFLDAGKSRNYYNISDGYWTSSFFNKTEEEMDEIRKKMSDSRYNFLNNRTEEQKIKRAKNASETMKKLYEENPDLKNFAAKTLASHCMDFWNGDNEDKKIEAKKKISKAMSDKFKDPIYKSKISKIKKEVMNDPFVKEKISNSLMDGFKNGTNKVGQAINLIIDNEILHFTTKKFAYYYLIEHKMLYYRTKDPNKQMSYSTFKRLTYLNETFPNFTYELIDKNDGNFLS